MRLIYKTKWKGGEIAVETETTVDDLVETLQNLTDEIGKTREDSSEMPEVSVGDLGCQDAIREVLKTPWGRSEPKTMDEIMGALETNAAFFSKGTMSGALSLMTKKGKLRRIKKGELWAYILPQ